MSTPSAEALSLVPGPVTDTERRPLLRLVGEGACGSAAGARVLARLSDDVGAERLGRYLDAGTRVEIGTEGVDITVASRFHADLIDRRLGTALRRAIRAELGADSAGASVRFRVDAERAVADSGAPRATARHPTPEPDVLRPRRRPPARGHLPEHRLEDFVVGEANRLAYEAAVRLSGCEDAVSLSPLFIHGPCGQGKTHLLSAIARRFRQRHPGAAVRYMTAEAFTNRFIAAIRKKTVDDFRATYRGVDLLCIDDVHFLANKEGTQSELVHTLDAIGLGRARIALASDEHPRLIHRLSQRLVSRFVSGMVVRLDPPEAELRLRLVRALAARRGLALDEESVRVLAGFGRRTPVSVRDLEGEITRVQAAHRLGGSGGPLTAAAVRRAVCPLGDSGRSRPRRPIRTDEIAEHVCGVLGVSSQDLLGRSRHKRVVLARSMTVFLTRKLTTMSYPEIARALARPNHSTVITAHQRIRGQIDRGETVDLGPGIDGVTLETLCADLADELIRGACGR